MVGVFVVMGSRQAQAGQREEAVRIVQESIMRAAISCYALEGAFPPTYAYLKENYHVYIDEGKYAVHYLIFASNMMPEITVVEK